MESEKVIKNAENDKYLKEHVTDIFTKIAIELLKVKPTNVVEFIGDWCRDNNTFY